MPQVQRLAAALSSDKTVVRYDLPLAPPDPPLLERWLDWLTADRSPVIDLYGRRLPRIREPAELDMRLPDAVGSTTQHPRKLPWLGLEAAYAKHIEGWTYVQVGEEYRLDVKQLVDPLPAYAALPPEARARHIWRLTRDGGRYWARLGAWPWAVFEEGRLTPGWRSHPLVGEALADWLEQQSSSKRRSCPV